MRRRHDTPLETLGVLRKEVRHLDVWPEQALPPHGEAAQPGAGRRGSGLRQAGGQSRRGIHVPRTGLGLGSHHRDIRHRAYPLPRPDTGATPRRGVCQEVPPLCGRGLHGAPAIQHHGQVRPHLRASFPAPQQLAGEEPRPLRQLQPDQRGRDIRQDNRHGAASAQVCRHLHHAGAGGTPPRPRGGAPLWHRRSRGTGRHGHHPLH